MRFLALCLCLTAVVAATPAQEPEVGTDDVLTLTSGKEVRGTMLLQNAKEIVVIDTLGRERKIQVKKIKSMRGPRADYPTYLEKLDLVYSARATAKDAMSFALWCQRHGFAAEVNMHYWRALDLDSNYTPAREKLGHRLGVHVWEVPTPSGSRLAEVDYFALRAEKKTPWVFATAHAQVKVSGPLHEALIAAATTERLYGHMLYHLRQYSPVQELLTPIEVRIFPSRRDAYPESGEAKRGWVDPFTGEVGLWLDGETVVDLPYATARGYLRAFIRQTSKGEAEGLAGWLDEAIGSYFQVCLRPTEGLPDYHPGRLDVDLIERALQNDGPIDLDTLLGIGRDGLSDSKDPDGAYAAAYGLLAWLWSQEDPKRHQDFGKYLESALEDLSGQSQFRKAYPKSFQRKMEENWVDFLKKSVLRRDN